MPLCLAPYSSLPSVRPCPQPGRPPLPAPLRTQLDQRPDTDVMQDALLEITGGRSVPRVFINGKFLGGGDDTAAAAANGSLQNLLTEAGVL